MIKKLVLSDGTRERELHLVGRIAVGRDPACEISHDDALLSRRHAEFVTAGNVVKVKDLGSRNGVFVNGARASEQELEPGDVVQIGPLRARFVVDAGPRSISPEALDVDRTAVIRKAPAPPPPVPAAVPVHPAVALAFEEVDEDATRLVPARAAESASDIVAAVHAARGGCCSGRGRRRGRGHHPLLGRSRDSCAALRPAQS
nr:FHA domain-containing protein [Acidobacteriota bacterium]